MNGRIKKFGLRFVNIIFLLAVFSQYVLPFNQNLNYTTENTDNFIKNDLEEIPYSIYYSTPKPNTITSQIPRYAKGDIDPLISAKPASFILDTDYCVIMIDFTDLSFTITPGEIEKSSLNGPNGLKSYFLENSYATYNISSQIVGNKTYSSGNTMSFYGEDGTNGEIDRRNGHPNRLALKALEVANADVDYSKFDTNGDGIVDHLIIIHAGPGQEEDPAITSRIWSHYSGLFTSVDGITFMDYVMVSEFSPMGVLAHECGHDLGLVDLYDTDYTSDGIGKWGIMAAGGWLSSPSHFVAYNKIRLGWMTPQRITQDLNVEVTIRQRNLYPDVVKVAISEKEYYLLENIYRNNALFDLSLPGDGILITHIDESRSTNDLDTRRLVHVVEAEANNELDRYGPPMGEAIDLWKNNPIGFADNTIPSARSHDGASSGWRMFNIGSAGATIKLDIYRSILNDLQIRNIKIPRFISLGTYNSTKNTYADTNISITASLYQNGPINTTDVPIILEIYRQNVSEVSRILRTTTTRSFTAPFSEININWTIQLNQSDDYIARIYIDHSVDENLENNEIFEAFQVSPVIENIDWDFESAISAEKSKWNFAYERYNLLGFYTTTPLSSYQWNLVNNNSVSAINPKEMPSPQSAWHFGFIRQNATWGVLEQWINLQDYNATMTIKTPTTIPTTSNSYLEIATNFILKETTDEKINVYESPSFALLNSTKQNRVLIQGSTDGSTWETLHIYTGIQTTWDRTFLNLTYFAGSSILIRIRVELMETVANGYFMFDTFRLSVIPPSIQLFTKTVTQLFNNLQPTHFKIPPNHTLQIPLKLANLGPILSKIGITGGFLSQIGNNQISAKITPESTELLPYGMRHTIITINTSTTLTLGQNYTYILNLTRTILLNGIEIPIAPRIVILTFESVSLKEYEKEESGSSVLDDVVEIWDTYKWFIVGGSGIGIIGVMLYMKKHKREKIP